MHFIFDNILSTLIAGVLFLLLLAVTEHGRRTTIEASSVYVRDQERQRFVDTLMLDMERLEVLHDVSTDSTGSVLRFDVRTGTDDALTRTVTYRSVPAASRGEGERYAVERSVEGEGVTERLSGLVRWRAVVQPVVQRVEVSGTYDPVPGWQIRVTFETIPRPGVPKKDSVWEAVFRPDALQQKALSDARRQPSSTR